MQISAGLFLAKWKMITGAIVVLLAGKLAVMLAAGQMFGLSRLASLRSGEQFTIKLWASACSTLASAHSEKQMGRAIQMLAQSQLFGLQ